MSSAGQCSGTMPWGRLSRIPCRTKPDEHNAQIAATGIERGWELIRQDIAERPQPPDDGGADDGAAVVATAPAISITQTRNVPMRGLNVSGLMNLT